MATERVWNDIHQETTRTYIMRTGDDIVINQPQRVGIKRSAYGEDSHIVWDANGNGVYIAAGEWVAIKWTGYQSTDEGFGDRLNAEFAKQEASEDGS